MRPVKSISELEGVGIKENDRGGEFKYGIF
jgi:hypothetical protein